MQDDCFSKEDRDELKKHGWQLDQIQIALKDIKDAALTVSNEAKAKFTDLELRTRDLENFKWLLWGMGTAVGCLIGWVLSAFIKK